MQQSIIYELTTSGDVLASFTTPSGIRPIGISMGKNTGEIWTVSGYPHRRIYKLSTTGELLSSFSIDYIPSDIIYDNKEERLWISTSKLSGL